MTLFTGFRQEFIDLGPARINIRIAGDGPPVLLLHGYPQTMAMWAKVADRLRRSRTVVCADLRGYGDSAGPANPVVTDYSFRTMAADQVAVMRTLGFDSFDLVGHDRGARTGFRLALDHPGVVTRLGVLDIAPLLDMLTTVTKDAALTYWHWYFLATPPPFPETLIGADPDYFFDTCFATWGATTLAELDPDQIDAYRGAWRRPEVIHATCQDYRAAMSVDLDHDRADADVQVDCPLLAMWGADSKIAKLYDFDTAWRRRAIRLRTATVPGGHFFVDQHPEQVADILETFLATPLDS